MIATSSIYHGWCFVTLPVPLAAEPELAGAAGRSLARSAGAPVFVELEAGGRKRHEFDSDLGEIAVRQSGSRRSDKINMSRGVRPYIQRLPGCRRRSRAPSAEDP